MSRKGKKKGRNKFRPPVRVSGAGAGSLQASAPTPDARFGRVRPPHLVGRSKDEAGGWGSR